MDELIAKIQDFFREKRTTAIILSLLIFFVFVALIIVCFQNPVELKSSGKKQTRSFENIVLDNDVFPPEGNLILKNYYPEREKKDAWSEDDCKKYLSLPDESLIEDLRKANGKIVDEIINSAP